MKSLAKNSIYNVIYSFLNILFPVFSSIYVARILKAESAGDVQYAQNIVSYFTTLAPLGMASHGLREISKAKDNRINLNTRFSELLLINTISTSFALALYVLLLNFGETIFVDKKLYLVCGIQIFFIYFSIDWLYQGLEEFPYIVKRNIFVKLLSIILIIVFVKKQSDYIIYALISSFALGLNNIFNIIHSKKYVKIFTSNLKIIQHLRPLMVFAVTTFLTTLYSKVDTTMLGIMCSKKEVAYYAYAQKIVQVIVTTSIAMSSVFLPRLVYYYQNDRSAFFRLIERGFKLLCFIVFPVSIGLFMISPYLIPLVFGEEFAPVSEAIRALILIIPLQSFGNLICYQIVICTGNEAKRIPVFIISSILNLLANYLLIPRFQAVGAAIASVIAELFLNSTLFCEMNRIIRIPINKKAILQSTVSSGIMAGIVILILRLKLRHGINVCLAILCGALVYLACNYIFKNEMMLEIKKRVSERSRKFKSK